MQGDDVTRVMGLAASGGACVFLGDFATARDYMERGLSLYEPAHDPPSPLLWIVSLTCWEICLDFGLPRISRSGAITLRLDVRRSAPSRTRSYPRLCTVALGLGRTLACLSRREPGRLVAWADSKLLALSIAEQRLCAYLRCVASCAARLWSWTRCRRRSHRPHSRGRNELDPCSDAT